ncbi:hypothetical protein, partial [Lactiplantibacillus plantarum]|uniref:hypothetical protein n=1 Tax=Lactiplantibacillus plantarum TaxID=1590 RepID=UPI00372D73CE
YRKLTSIHFPPYPIAKLNAIHYLGNFGCRMLMPNGFHCRAYPNRTRTSTHFHVYRILTSIHFRAYRRLSGIRCLPYQILKLNDYLAYRMLNEIRYLPYPIVMPNGIRYHVNLDYRMSMLNDFHFLPCQIVMRSGFRYR